MGKFRTKDGGVESQKTHALLLIVAGALAIAQELTMKKLVLIVIAAGLAVAFALPGFAATKMPTTKARRAI
jgi:hypothetical protein